MDDYGKYIYSSGTHYISNNGHDESGGYSGGTAGDQTGDEWCLRSWYNRPWDCVLRYPNDNVALKIAELGCAAALNDKIGYDQNQRDTYWTQLQKAGYDPSKITTACEADCSAGVIANVKAVGHLMGISALQNITSTYTGNMKSGFKSAGFSVLTASKYLTDTKYLKPGDILLNESAHTATNVTLGSKASFEPSTTSTTAGGKSDATVDPKTVWDSLMGWIGNAYGVAGFMGNIKAESAFIPINLQDSYESKLGYTDQTYTDAVDNGTYTKFSSDSAGYGLCQWTYSTRKKALKAYCDGIGASIGNADAQLGYLKQEVESDFSSMLKTLKNATSVKEASDAVLTKFEQPADQSSSVKTKRASYGQEYYDQYAGTSTSTSGTKTIDELAQEVIAGKWGNNPERAEALTAAGYDAAAVQALVDKLYGVGGSSSTDPNGIAYAEKLESGYSGGKTYKVYTSSGLNMRKGPSNEKLSNGKYKYDIIKALPNGTKMTYYGYYTKTSGTKWMLVISGGTTGWVCSTYVKKV